MSQATPDRRVERSIGSLVRTAHQAVARGLALFFAGFTVLNLVGELAHGGFDATLWWIDLRGLPGVLRTPVLIAFSATLIDSICRPVVSTRHAHVRVFILLLVLLCVGRDAISFWRLHTLGVVHATFPVPFSLLIAGCLLTVLLDQLLRPPLDSGERKVRWPARLTAIATVGTCLVTFPLLQMYCFGWTDYRRSGDVAVVFGCRVYASGRLSAPLADRVRSACELYHEGLVDRLLMSGGPATEKVHETHAMRDFAVELGVPRERILIDEFGLSTDETVSSTTPLLRARGFDRVLAVSHFYHLPRIKLAFHRAGLDVFTVPATPARRMKYQELLLAREVVALWAYYLRPLTGI